MSISWTHRSMKEQIGMTDEARALANLFCLYKGSNASFAKRLFGIWAYTDGIAVHNLQAFDSENDGHLALFRKKLADAHITVKGFSRCDCHQCWVIILEGNRSVAGQARQLVFDAATECVGLPAFQPNALDHPIEPPDFPTIEQHATFIKGLEKHGLLRCSRMTREGQRRTKIDK